MKAILYLRAKMNIYLCTSIPHLWSDLGTVQYKSSTGNATEHCNFRENRLYSLC
jgi:hypothetical protein